MSTPRALLNEILKAMSINDVEKVASLLASGHVDPNAIVVTESQRLGTLLTHATELGNCKLVQLLLNAGARVSCVNDSGKTACFVAVGLGHADVVDALIAHLGTALAVQLFQETLSVALNLSSDRILIALIKVGVAVDADKLTMCRVASTSAAVVHLLVQRGHVIANWRDSGGETPCHAALRRADDVAVLEALVSVAGVALHHTVVDIATTFGRVNSLRWLIDAGADFSVAAADGVTPLIAACASSSRCAHLLIAAGADVHARANDGCTAAHYAADSDSLLTLFKLLAAGADIDAADNSGVTPRQICAKMLPTAAQLDGARRLIAAERLRFVRQRAFQVCVGLQSRGLDALLLCEILLHSCGRVAPLVEFHHWWAIATTVKHFKRYSSS